SRRLEPSEFYNLPHVSVSSTSLSESTGAPDSMMPPRSENRVKIVGSRHICRLDLNSKSRTGPPLHVSCATFPSHSVSSQIKCTRARITMVGDPPRGRLIAPRHWLALSGMSIWRLIGNVSLTSKAFRGVLGRHRQPSCRLAS